MSELPKLYLNAFLMPWEGIEWTDLNAVAVFGWKNLAIYGCGNFSGYDLAFWFY